MDQTTTKPPSTRKKAPEPPKCTICDENYNKTFRAPVTCLCDFTCCRTCAKQYIASKVEDAHCMSCRVKWNRDFMMNHFEKTYISNDYRVYRENILFEKEMGLLPMTQPHVEKAITVEKLEEEYKEIVKESEEIQRKLAKKRNEINEIEKGKDVERRKYVRKCPKNDCQGFLSQNLKCEICNSWVCGECREIKGTTRDTEHTCHPDILETVKLLASDTKPCPKCSSMIYKIEGCSQMFCTECHTAFDWNTLRIETGVVHNPHYFEWLRTRNNTNGLIERNPNEILCGRELDMHFVQTLRNGFARAYNLSIAKTNIEFKQKMFALLAYFFKDLIPAYYKNLIQEIDNNAELKRKFAQNNPFEYSITLVRIVNVLLNRNRILDTNSSTIDSKYFVRVSKKIQQLEISRMEENMIVLDRMIRNVTHIQVVELRRWTVRDQITSNLDLRILYMRNKIEPELFKNHIQRRDKESQRNLEINNILRMYISCITDLLYRVFDKINTFNNNEEKSKEELEKVLLEIFGKEDQECLLKEFHELRKYTNECMKTVFVTYGSKMAHHINPKFEYTITL